mmetsp:Transcript_4796/g.11278  ORF Transcript_4796/g.11278 Transcript_4796/m.11278 type:complete len:155 (-) Transcript_4796:276-740(-)
MELLLRLLVLHYSLAHVCGFTKQVSPRVRKHQTVAKQVDQWIAQDILDATSAIGGGTIGVVGTIVALELKKREIKKKAECPYCLGGGFLTCAQCMGGRTVIMKSGGGQQSCSCCDASGQVTCVNCKGDGRLVPTMLSSTASRDPESELEDIGMA